MGILDNFERGLERVVNGAFAKTFRSGLQPVEVSAALKRELETKAAVVTRERILVPNRFVVQLAPADFERLRAIGQTLIDDFTRVVQKHATEQGFQFAGPVTIELDRDDKLSDGMLQIESSNVSGSDVSWMPVIDVNGQRHPLRMGITVIGRGHDANITVDDNGISRRHLQILWDGSRAQAKDLGSTNGSQLNGQRFTSAVLEPDSIIQIGRTQVVFRVVPQPSGTHIPDTMVPGSHAGAPAASAAAPVPASAFPPADPAESPAAEAVDHFPPAPAPAPAPAEPFPAQESPAPAPRRPAAEPDAGWEDLFPDAAVGSGPDDAEQPHVNPHQPQPKSKPSRPDPHSFWRDL